MKFTGCVCMLQALENTSLMRTYSKIDSRVPVLGTMLKSMVKQMRINDASKRTLSSYAYLNMLVYFLQRCDPPVLPVLQELHDGAGSKKGKQSGASQPPQRLIDGKNVWFQSNMDYIVRSTLFCMLSEIIVFRIYSLAVICWIRFCEP